MTRAKDISKIITDADFSGTLDVTGTVTAGGLTVEGSTAPTINIKSTDAVVVADDVVGAITFEESDATGGTGVQAFIKAIANDSGNTYDMSIGVGGNTEAIRVDQSGNVGIGDDAPDMTTVIAYSDSGTDFNANDFTGGLGIYNTNDSNNTSSAINFKGGSRHDVVRIGAVRTSNSTSTSSNSADFVVSTRHLGSTLGERFRITSNGSVGIGNSNPSQLLEVSGKGVFSTANPDVNGLKITATTGTNASAMTFSNTATAYVGLDNSVGGRISGVPYGLAVWNGSAYPVVFGTNGSERMRIDSSGNVGIGVVPETDWSSTGTALQIGGMGFICGTNGTGDLGGALMWGSNARQTSGWGGTSNWKYIANEQSAMYQTGDGKHRFFVAGAGSADAAITWNEAVIIENNGRIKLGGTDQDGHVHTFGNFASGYSAVFHNDGNNSNRYGILSKSGADDASGTNYAFDIADGNGTVQGSITFSGGTVTYGAFTAFHPCIIPNADNDADSTANAYPYGTLLEITSIGYTQKDGADTERGITYNVQKSSSAKSKAVLGAYGSSMNDEERGNTNLHQALILGDGHILCNNENGNIAVGDYICTSSTSGEGMKATSICTTIGIAREAITFTDSTAVLVAVEYGYRQFVPEDLEARILALETA